MGSALAKSLSTFVSVPYGKTFQSNTARAVDHPEHGELLHAADVVGAIGYSTSGGAAPYLNQAGVPQEERILLNGSTLTFCLTDAGRVRFGKATFLTEKGVNLLLMSSTRPQAREFRDWLAGDVVPTVADTGGYLLNEEVRTVGATKPGE